MDIKFSNNASSYLIKAATSSDTTLVVAPDTLHMFPDLTYSTDYFIVTLSDSNANIEIVKVVEKNLVENTLIVQRAQEGTQAIDFPINSLVEHRLTAGSLDHILNDVIATVINPGRISIATEDDLLDGTSTTTCITPSLAYLFNMPVGSIIMYSGAVNNDGYVTYPDGTVNTTWSICDGTRNTPDLRGRFIMGASVEFPQHSRGGSNDERDLQLPTITEGHAITIEEMPSHDHSVYATSSVERIGTTHVNHNAVPGTIRTGKTGGNAEHTHDITIEVPTLEILPAYYVLTYIMKLK